MAQTINAFLVLLRLYAFTVLHAENLFFYKQNEITEMGLITRHSFVKWLRITGAAYCAHNG